MARRCLIIQRTDCPLVGYGPTPAYSGTIALQAVRKHNVEVDYRRVGGFFDSFEQGGLTGLQVSWASLEAPPNFVKDEVCD